MCKVEDEGLGQLVRAKYPTEKMHGFAEHQKLFIARHTRRVPWNLPISLAVDCIHYYCEIR